MVVIGGGNKNGGQPPRSNSSLAFRESLKRRYVVVPEINDRVDLMRYLQPAERLLHDAYQSQCRGDLTNAYIDYQKFLVFVVERLPKHRAYQSLNKQDPLRRWCTDNAQEALKKLEDVARELDNEEDRRREAELDDYLLDQLEDDFDGPSTPVASPRTPKLSTVSSSTVLPTDAMNQVVGAMAAVAIGEDDAEMRTSFKNSITLDSLSMMLLEGSMAAVSTSSAPVTAPTPAASNLPSVPPTPSASIKVRDPSALRILELPSPSDTSPPPAPVASSVGAPAASIPSGKVLSVTPPRSMFTLRCTVPEDIAIVKAIISLPSMFQIPRPVTTILQVPILPNKALTFERDDFHVSFTGFLQFLPSELQMARSAMEVNRCFFIHVGIAIGVHPFLLQIACRELAAYFAADKECWFAELVQTFQVYAGFVDANGLCFLWPEEFNHFRFLFISGTTEAPIFSSFTLSGPKQDFTEIIIHCNGSHFTLLRPHANLLAQYGQGGPNNNGFKVIDHIIADAKATGKIVQENVATPPPGLPSIKQVIQAISATK